MSNLTVYVNEPVTKGKVVLHTTVGPFDVELWSKEAPLACRNFVQLCLEGYYDGCVFHRVIKEFMAQTGDPTGTGTGGESVYGAPFKDECHGRLRFTHRGLLGMASSGPNTNGSQFFLTYGKAPHLDNNYAVFGKTIDGWDTLDAMERQPVNEAHRPLAECAVQSITIHANPLAEQMIVFPTATGPPDIQS